MANIVSMSEGRAELLKRRARRASERIAVHLADAAGALALGSEERAQDCLEMAFDVLETLDHSFTTRAAPADSSGLRAFRAGPDAEGDDADDDCDEDDCDEDDSDLDDEDAEDFDGDSDLDDEPDDDDGEDSDFAPDAGEPDGNYDAGASAVCERKLIPLSIMRADEIDAADGV